MVLARSFGPGALATPARHNGPFRAQSTVGTMTGGSLAVCLEGFVGLRRHQATIQIQGARAGDPGAGGGGGDTVLPGAETGQEFYTRSAVEGHACGTAYHGTWRLRARLLSASGHVLAPLVHVPGHMNLGAPDCSSLLLVVMSC